jgi:hypothetical protein
MEMRYNNTLMACVVSLGFYIAMCVSSLADALRNLRSFAPAKTNIVGYSCCVHSRCVHRISVVLTRSPSRSVVLIVANPRLFTVTRRTDHRQLQAYISICTYMRSCACRLHLFTVAGKWRADARFTYFYHRRAGSVRLWRAVALIT